MKLINPGFVFILSQIGVNPLFAHFGSYYKVFVKYSPGNNFLRKWNKKITFPLLFSIICCLTQYHRQDHLETFFLCIGTEFYMGLKKTFLGNMLLSFI